MRWGLAEAYITLDDRFEHQVFEMLAQLGKNLLMNLGASVEHSYHKAFDGKLGIEPVLDNADGLKELAEALQGKKLRLDRYYYRIGRG